jgi:hypothetical protein
MPAKSSSTPSNAARCQHRTAAGRQCRSLTDDSSSGLCPHHAVPVSVKINFRDELTHEAFEFQRSQGVNNSLGVLYKLLAEGSISPRRASVLAYISSLLLRTLPAIDHDNARFGYDDDEPQDSGEEVEDNDEAEEENDDEATEGPAPEPLPATAREFADAVLSRKPS